MKILLLGKNGQLGSQLLQILPSLGEIKAYDRSDFDLTDKRAVISAIEKFNPNVIINAAAYTFVDKAESENKLAFKINTEAVTTLANEAKKRNIWLIHYSTDYVFDGLKTTPYYENDAPNPINIYGKSKLAGEQAIVTSRCKHLILRTTWVIGKHGQNFVKTILRLATERKSLGIVNDQFGVPTTTGLITKVTLVALKAIANSNAWPSGIYHLTPSGKTTWYDMAKIILRLAKKEQMDIAINENKLHAIATADYPTPAKRPINSILATDKLKKQLDFTLPHWQNDFVTVTKEIIRSLK